MILWRVWGFDEVGIYPIIQELTALSAASISTCMCTEQGAKERIAIGPMDMAIPKILWPFRRFNDIGIYLQIQPSAGPFFWYKYFTIYVIQKDER
jgi:hypothetical protein